MLWQLLVFLNINIKVYFNLLPAARYIQMMTVVLRSAEKKDLI